MSRSVFVNWHLGLGDSIICAAIIRDLARNHDLVVVPAKYGNLESVSYLFNDLPNVVVRGVESHDEMRMMSHGQYGLPPVWKGKRLTLGQDNSPFNASIFDQEFYRQAGMDFNLRWDGFRLNRKLEMEVSAGQTIRFFHHDPLRGFRMNVFEWIMGDYHPRMESSANLFAHLPAVLSARECHCINSSFALLIDSLPDDWWTEPPKLYLHMYARPYGEVPTFKKNWEKIT